MNELDGSAASGGYLKRHHEVGDLAAVLDFPAHGRAGLCLPIDAGAPEIEFGRQQVDAVVADRVDQGGRSPARLVGVHLRSWPAEIPTVIERLQAPQNLLLAGRRKHRAQERDDLARRDVAVARRDFQYLLVAVGEREIRQGARLAHKPRQAL